MHVETYSDRKKKKFFTRDPLSQVLYFDGFAKELVSGVNNGNELSGQWLVFFVEKCFYSSTFCYAFEVPCNK
jgi:hypothetical protein